MVTDGWESSRRAALALLAVAAAAVAIAAVTGTGRVTEPAVLELVLLLAAGLVAALHRPFGQRGAAAGVVVWPLIATGWGAAIAAAVGAATVVAADGIRALAALSRPVAPPASWRLWATTAAAARTALAVVGASLAAATAGGDGAAALRPIAAGTAAYLLIGTLASAGERAWRTGRSFSWRLLVPPPALAARLSEAAAWAVGASLVAAPASVELVVVAAVALLAVEAGRQSLAAARLEERLGELGRVHGAGQRMVGGPTEIGSVVERIHAECANVVPFHWFQLELLPGDGEVARSWCAGPDGVLAAGAPEPEPYPPPIPGIHRRSDWQRVERLLDGPDRPVARLVLWCDPRRLEPQDLALFEALLPQMATSIRQALLDREAREDRLTGAAVRRVLEKRLFDAFRRAVEEGRTLAVVMVDVDRFKPINDRYGHATGDRALAAVGAVLAQHKRTQDLLARYGGEEFTLLLEDADGATALAVAERLRRAVEEIDFDGLPLALTVSAGIAAFPEVHVKTSSELLLLADAALYEAKNRGRNRCLLDLGRARYLGPGGEVVGNLDVSPEPPPPRIFA